MITPEMLPIIIYILTAIILILLILVARNEMRVSRLLKGGGAKTLEDTLKTIEKDSKKLFSAQEKTDSRLDNAEEQLEESIQKVGIVRFNPFKGTSGSNQSYSVALLNKNKDGIVMSSLYSREHVSVFAKPISGGKSEYDLTNEEKKAITETSNKE